jgi:hypothetical protein
MTIGIYSSTSSSNNVHIGVNKREKRSIGSSEDDKCKQAIMIRTYYDPILTFPVPPITSSSLAPKTKKMDTTNEDEFDWFISSSATSASNDSSSSSNTEKDEKTIPGGDQSSTSISFFQQDHPPVGRRLPPPAPRCR